MHFLLIAQNLEVLLWSESRPSERPSSTPDKQLPSSPHHSLSLTLLLSCQNRKQSCKYKEEKGMLFSPILCTEDVEDVTIIFFLGCA